MKAVVLKCEPGSHFHFGKYAPDDDTALNDSDDLMHSDTLFSALINTCQDCFGNAQDMVDAFAAGQVRISSLFYCLEQNTGSAAERYAWLLPKPVSFNLFESADYKSFRSIRFISKKVWETVGDPVSMLDITRYQRIGQKGMAVIAGDEIRLPEEEKELILPQLELYKIETLPKVKVRDVPGERGIYQLTVTGIADNTQLVPGLYVHFYFLLDDAGLNETLRENLLAVIEMLRYNGIGAERTTIGKIVDTEIVNDWKIVMEDEDPDHKATMSLLSPRRDDPNKMKCYKTIIRGGRRIGKPGADERSKPDYLKSVRMAAEGAIVQKQIAGQLADVSPGNTRSYLRNGIPLCLPVRSKWIH